MSDKLRYILREYGYCFLYWCFEHGPQCHLSDQPFCALKHEILEGPRCKCGRRVEKPGETCCHCIEVLSNYKTSRRISFNRGLCPKTKRNPKYCISMLKGK
jgi:hypothetical protein